jgi:cytochrome c oxidase subunit 4
MATHSHSHAEGHGNAVRTYSAVLGALLVLTVITVAASRVDFGSLNVIIAIGIATLKASLVALYFMHLRYDKPMNAVIFVVSLLFLGLFLAGCLTDVESRWDIQPTNLKVQTTPAAAAAAAPGETAAPAVNAPAQAAH